MCLANGHLITSSSSSSATPDLNASESHFYLSQQQYKGGLTTAQSLVATVDKSNFILKEHQQRSINGDSPPLIDVDTGDDKSGEQHKIGRENASRDSDAANLNILSSGSSSAASSLMSSPVVHSESNSEQHAAPNNNDDDTNEQEYKVHADFFESENKLVDFAANRFVWCSPLFFKLI